MIKLIATGVWVLVVTLGGVYAAVTFGGNGATDQNGEVVPPPHFVSSETVTLPVVANGKVSGYFLVRASLQVDEEALKEVTVPVPAFLTDELYTLLVGEKLVDIKDAGKFDVVGLKTRIKDGLNTRLEKPLVKDILIEQMDFISKEDIEARDPNKKPQKILVNTDAPPAVPAAAAASSGH
jgi:flagellar basal body-associated protein FliL